MLLPILRTLIALQGGLTSDERYPPDCGPNLKSGDEFDFIIVGGGSAGTLLANRLSETPHWKILLLEAGGYPSDLSEIPGAAFSMQGTEEDWQYRMEKSDTCCLGLVGNVCSCPRGKGLGGSSLINVMMYTRSTRYDHARWADAGNTHWDYDSIVKYYKKFENADVEENAHYGTSGELHLTRYTSDQPIRQILARGYEELGYSEYTEDHTIGFRDVLTTIYQGTRQNTAKAFLTFDVRKNLHVATRSQVGRILVDRAKLTAHGVEVKIGGKLLKLTAKMEVIVSAGSINSPQILMNSGIGPKEHLEEMGIEVVKDLRVGDNYEDHLLFPAVIVRIDESAVSPVSTWRLMNEVYQFFMNRGGMLTQIEITNFNAYVNAQNGAQFANVQIFHGIVHKQDPYLVHEFLRVVRMPENIKKEILELSQNSPLLVFSPTLLHPKSKGRIRLRNNDPFSEPLIVPNFLSDEHGEDIEVLLSSIKLLTALNKTDAFVPHSPKMIDLNITNCRAFVSQSDDFWKCAVRNIGVTVYHPTGTCKMGPESDASSVVDPQLKVHGVKNLRVIDGSVIPIIPSCNTNAPILMIAEKGAAILKEDWLNRHDEL